MSYEVVIKVEGLSKCYPIYSQPKDRLKQFFYPRLQRLFGIDPKQYFKEFMALDNVSFEIRRGETVGIVGRNGSGKSTLLQLICGTLSQTAGSIKTKGRIAALLELGSGFNPEFTGKENVYLNASILGLSKQEIDSRYEDILIFADIGDFINQPVKTYSSGMLVRLAFAVIAHVSADILVIDEALAVGDAFFTQKCMRFLRQFMKEGTVLFVSHDTGSIKSLCNKAIWLEKGSALKQGHPKDISESYLQAFYEENQGKNTNVIPSKNKILKVEPYKSLRDKRLDFINNSRHRNDLKLYKFNPDAAFFGNQDAQIVGVNFLDQEHNPCSWIIGGELVRLRVCVEIIKSISSPIVGFFIKDNLGQTLFGENTYLTHQFVEFECHEGEQLLADFVFHMPTLPKGDYSVAVAVASGTQFEHIQHHWIHDAILFKSESTSVSTGLVGIPMLEVDLKKSYKND